MLIGRGDIVTKRHLLLPAIPPTAFYTWLNSCSYSSSPLGAFQIFCLSSDQCEILVQSESSRNKKQNNTTLARMVSDMITWLWWQEPTPMQNPSNWASAGLKLLELIPDECLLLLALWLSLQDAWDEVEQVVDGVALREEDEEEANASLWNISSNKSCNSSKLSSSFSCQCKSHIWKPYH